MTCCMLMTVAVALGCVQRPDHSPESLRAAMIQWHRDIEFVCTYRCQFGLAASAEDAEQGIISRELTEASGRGYVATGVFVKRNDDLRYSRNYERGPQQIGSPTGGGNAWTNVSVDEALHGEVTASFTPSLSKSGRGVMRLFNRRRDSAHKDTAGVYVALCHPLSPITGISTPDLFELMDDPTAEVSMQSPTPGVVELAIKTNKKSLALTFNVEKPSPVLTGIQLTRRRDEGDFVTNVRLSDFVKCDGGYVARRLIKWGAETVYVWESDDLGDRKPTDNDFTISVPGDAAVLGVVSPERFLDNSTGEYRVPIAELTRADLTTQAPLLSNTNGIAATPGEIPSRSWRWIIVFASLIIFGAVVSYFAIRRRKKHIGTA